MIFVSIIIQLLFTKQIVKLFHFFNEVFRGKLFPLDAVLFLAI